ncbi:MAG TPA: SAM-dependent methyltransferase, partial [Phycisphaerae bacterium]|nr:SAM-dependent methyltransferase [Phycisphaerae bacterium]
MAQPCGRVYLVGAGPGDPGLLTLRGAELLARADVVVYDRLVPAEMLAMVRPQARRLFVGKTPGRPGTSQDEINAILVREAGRAAVVVRLKGGDPFVFGRGGEEAIALKQA